MVVYWEFAFAENFMLDGLLLYLALKCAKGKVRVLNLLLAAVVGAGETIAFPLIPLPTWCAYPVKIAGGLILVLIAVSKGTKKTYLVAAGAFFMLTFALGGLLTAAYSFFDVAYEEGNGYLVESAPVGFVFGAAGIFAVVVVWAAKSFYRYRRLQRGIFDCTLVQSGREVRWKGFADSGNCLVFRGEPVCVISAKAAFALFGRELKEVGRMQIGTVNGGRDSPVFLCQHMCIGKFSYENVHLAVGEVDTKEYQIILHTLFVEGEHETARRTSDLATEDKGKRKRHSLPLRK